MCLFFLLFVFICLVGCVLWSPMCALSFLFLCVHVDCIGFVRVVVFCLLFKVFVVCCCLLLLVVVCMCFCVIGCLWPYVGVCCYVGCLFCCLWFVVKFSILL